MKFINNAIFSKCCPVCLSTVDVAGLCQRCLLGLPPLGSCCRVCLAPLDRQAGDICARCSMGVPFDQVVALTRYTYPLSDLICRLKYRQHLYLAKVLGSLLANHLQNHHWELPELLVTVPLHKQRIQQRGFNQAIEIARTVSTQLNLKADYRCLEKFKMTPLQSTLNSKQRRHNLKRAFRMRHPLPRYVQSVAVLDDVMTTGTTVSEIASLLKANDVSRVEVWVLARTSSLI